MNASIETEILQIAQTIGVITALGFTSIQMRKHIREQRFHDYFSTISHGIDLGKMMVENPNIHAVYEYSPTNWIEKSYEELTPSKKSMIHYCDLVIALCEVAWLGDQEKILPGEWPYWKVWVDQLQNSPAFRWTLEWVRDDYDEDFLCLITSRKEDS